ncbi:MAG: hypothetical protein NZZ60_03950 [Bacteroidia bacterium]|nr:hypothetical protein [Bacteroidia bacterium]MCX7652470.1 hypothetical protein [Bacteroidia bacterium]MDW8416872.1 hypothetical protein [Bacteroidia bacterium]
MAEPIRYRLSWESPQRYIYQIEIVASPTKGPHTDFALPAWRPGRYILQNYAGAVSHFHAEDEKGRPLLWRKVTKDLWRVQNPTHGRLRVRYRFYAKQIDAGSSYLSPDLVYFNPINLFMYLPERLGEACELELPALPPTWKVATALPQKDHRLFYARDYHHLADSPFLSAPTLRSEKTTCAGATIHVHFHGPVSAQSLSGFLSDICKIVQTQVKIWGSLPLKEYHFIYLLVPFQMRHAVEHEYSAMFVLPAEGAASEQALKGFLGISAHEFFHVWNVKRLRPAALVPYRYDREAYTSLHWLTEGITDYYSNLTLARAGIISPEEYWQRLSNELTQIENAYAYKVFSPAELSIDSWLATSTYRPALYQGSFYAAGKRVGFLLDMLLRKHTDGKVNLDSLLRFLYDKYYLHGRGIPEDGVEMAAVQLAGEPMRSFFAKYVWGKEPIPYEELLKGLPIRVKYEETTYPGLGKLGILRIRAEDQGLRIEEILPESIAEKIGLEVGDMLVSIDNLACQTLPESFWERLPVGKIVSLSWVREGFLMEGQFAYQPESLSKRVNVQLSSAVEGFIP